MIGFDKKCSIFDATIHMGGVTIRKRNGCAGGKHVVPDEVHGHVWVIHASANHGGGLKMSI